ncbi:MAG: OprO/OprP family phosphate-selective porin [Desulfobacula sp.]|nr:OprO/OprP family phosphate-selective porin [Desulfobacula sp.]
MKKLVFCLILITMSVFVSSSWAGMKLKISDDTDINLGFRLQSQYLSTDNQSGTTGNSYSDFNVRRARLRLGGNVTKWMSFFIQTEKGSGDGGSGYDMRLIDTYVSLNLNPLAKIYLGQHMAPASRQIVTTSGGLMAIDRPNVTNYNLTWGLNGRTNFNTATFSDGNLGLGNSTAVRDEGATLFGSTSMSDTLHVKYYLGLYDGIQVSGNDNKRFTGRIQVNFLDPEAGYFNTSTYLGKKKTFALGVSYDKQDGIAADDVLGAIDYSWFEIDAFVEYPVGNGSLTFETAYLDLDLDNATQLNDSTATRKDARQTQGNGWYAQTGYLFKDTNIQPWAAYEQWESDATDNTGSFDSWRVGLTYFFKGHNANIKVGYESLKSDTNIGSSTEDTIDTFLVGFYITY